MSSEFGAFVSDFSAVRNKCPLKGFLTTDPSNLFCCYVFVFSSDGLSCIAGCRCPQEAFNPVCGSDGVEFRSPCHAGCSSMETDTNNKATVRIVLSFHSEVVVHFFHLPDILLLHALTDTQHRTHVFSINSYCVQ